MSSQHTESAANGGDPIYNGDVSELTKQEIDYWSQKLQLTPSEMFALSEQELEEHLSYALEVDQLEYAQQEPRNDGEEGHNPSRAKTERVSFLKECLNCEEEEDVAAPSNTPVLSTPPRLKAGGIEDISDTVWNILWNAALKIDKLYGGPPQNTNSCMPAMRNNSNKFNDSFHIPSPKCVSSPRSPARDISSFNCSVGAAPSFSMGSSTRSCPSPGPASMCSFNTSGSGNRSSSACPNSTFDMSPRGGGPCANSTFDMSPRGGGACANATYNASPRGGGACANATYNASPRGGGACGNATYNASPRGGGACGNATYNASPRQAANATYNATPRRGNGTYDLSGACPANGTFNATYDNAPDMSYGDPNRSFKPSAIMASTPKRDQCGRMPHYRNISTIPDYSGVNTQCETPYHQRMMQTPSPRTPQDGDPYYCPSSVLNRDRTQSPCSPPRRPVCPQTPRRGNQSFNETYQPRRLFPGGGSCG